LIAALTAVASNDVADRENIDPLASLSGKDFNDQGEKYPLAEDFPESSFDTVTYYDSKPEGFWSESTPAASNGQGRKSLTRRKSTKNQSTATSGLYPQLSVYPDISGDISNAPTTSTEEFGKIADNILEEMNARIAGNSTFPRAEKSKTSAKQNCRYTAYRAYLQRCHHSSE
jgi:hypothetical protein